MTRPSAPNPWATEGGQAAGGTGFTVASSANPSAGFPARRARPLVRHWPPSPPPHSLLGFCRVLGKTTPGKTALFPHSGIEGFWGLFDGELRKKRFDGEIANHHEPDHRESWAEGPNPSRKQHAGNVRIGRCTSVMVAQS
ncbi:hypothetical protein F5144DRAFT_493008 [Chaetomium tenue]|uniref:Uncharacterized protein n=1 Tax=Chaetomium tenue TaxID=1854479 RepID=A0ACB7P4K4_9PEZI|nr:hypothetical protein F5144DRAFT_493008 [Chaetomium globosum]